jgi:reactive intermediate/imine deaminase
MKKFNLTLTAYLFLTSFSLFASAHKLSIETSHAPAPLGTYSQAMQFGSNVYISGQIGLSPETGALVSPYFEDQVEQVFKNLLAITEASNHTINDIVKLTVYVSNLENFDTINQAMEKVFTQPYPARSVIEVKALPKNALIEVEAILSAPEVQQEKKSMKKNHSANFLALVTNAKKSIKEISARDLYKKMQSHEPFVLIDVREQYEWSEGRLPQAVHLSKGILERDIERKVVDLNTPIIVYCSGGFRGALSAQSLQKMGYTNVQSLESGSSEWMNQNYPYEK